MLIYHPLTSQLHLYFSDAPRLPDSLEEALVELEKDTAIVDALGEEFIRWYVVRPTQYKLSILKYQFNIGLIIIKFDNNYENIKE